jgi:hypothetical protein
MRISTQISVLAICLLLVACAGTKEAKVTGLTDIPVKKENPKPPPTAPSPAEVEKETLLLKTLKNPPVPLKGQNKIVRVMFLPYVDQNGILHTQQYAFIQVDEGKWIMGDYLLAATKKGRRLLKPLDNPAPAETPGPSHAQPNIKGNTGTAKESPLEAPLTPAPK